MPSAQPPSGKRDGPGTPQRPGPSTSCSGEEAGGLLLGVEVVVGGLLHGNLDVTQDVLQVLRRGGPALLALRVHVLRLADPRLDERPRVVLELAKLRLEGADGLLDVGGRLLQRTEVDDEPAVTHVC